jgi:hypothetical protein
LLLPEFDPMHLKYQLRIKQLLFALTLIPLMSLANEADKPGAADPHAQHPGTASQPTNLEPVKAPGEGEAPKTEESSSKGLVVQRAPDFCMKKDPPPHCSE